MSVSMCSEGYGAVSVSLCVWTTTIVLLAMKWLMSDMNIFSATNALKLKWRFSSNCSVWEFCMAWNLSENVNKLIPNGLP